MTTRPQAAGRAATIGARRKLDAFPDRIDLRDWPYQPTLASLPDALVNCSKVPAILDQGREGACTGFALSAAVTFLLARRGVERIASPRMLYEMARCYDEWPGENYEGSSARGAMKGWARHGVCERALWKDEMHGRRHLDAAIGKAALATPCGAYYRVKHREVRDVHAALSETGVAYCTLMVHEGWDAPGKLQVQVSDGGRTRRLPVIARKGRAESGHAVALVGYTRDGFVVQNSWGRSWGGGGFALLPYEDFMLHVTDLWVVQLGVPLSVDLWAREGKSADSTSGRTRASGQIPLAEIRPYVVDVGNNGELSQNGDYWTCEEDLARLFRQTIPQAAASHGWDKKRVMLYLHGGLNGEKAAAKRAVAMRDKCLANGIYPLHLMWETGPLETISSIVGDLFTSADERAGGGLLEGLRNARDFTLELTASPIGGPMWSEMKENAWRASDHRGQRGAIQLMRKYAQESLSRVDQAERAKWELHVVAHSAGSILFAHAVEHLCSLGIAFRTLQFFAPAIRVDEFRRYAMPWIWDGRCPRASNYVLSEQQELDDSVGPYGRSLLWLVSNAFEDQRGTPLLGMQVHLKGEAALRRAAFLEVVESAPKGTRGAASTAQSHGGFDNDAPTMNSALARILGRKPKVEFTQRDLDD
ncbi:MAG: C1 family peptidase [Burkholderiales bacterium]|nr:C1 family peptidase [Burkholderiales bacterium]